MLYKEEFLSYLRFEKRYSDHTIKSYDNDLNQFRVFCEQTGVKDPEFDSGIIRLWVVSLLEDRSKPPIHPPEIIQPSFICQVSYYGKVISKQIRLIRC